MHLPTWYRLFQPVSYTHLDVYKRQEIHSFSYKKGGIPKDHSDNGGGFCFDCRGILNPGRIEEYKQQTGRDFGVQNYLETKTEMPTFLKLVKNLVSITTVSYTHLDVYKRQEKRVIENFVF